MGVPVGPNSQFLPFIFKALLSVSRGVIVFSTHLLIIESNFAAVIQRAQPVLN